MPRPNGTAYLHELADGILTYEWETAAALALRAGVSAEQASASLSAAYVRGTAYRREVPRERRIGGAWEYRKAGPLQKGDTAWY